MFWIVMTQVLQHIFKVTTNYLDQYSKVKIMGTHRKELLFKISKAYNVFSQY